MNNIEGMKKLIEEKKKQSSQQGVNGKKPSQTKVNSRKAFRNKKSGGVFDK